MPRKRRTSRNAGDGAVVIKIDGPGELPEKRVDVERPSSDAVDAVAIGLYAERINTREELSWRVWLVIVAAVVGLVFPWWYGVVSLVVDAGRGLGWW